MRDALLCYAERASRIAEQEGCQGRCHRLQDRRARRRFGERPSRCAIPRQRHQQSALRIPLGRSIQRLTRSRNCARVPRRNASAGRRKDCAFLLDVWSSLLFHADNGRRSQVRGRAGDQRERSSRVRLKRKSKRVCREGRGSLRKDITNTVEAAQTLYRMTRTLIDEKAFKTKQRYGKCAAGWPSLSANSAGP